MKIGKVNDIRKKFDSGKRCENYMKAVKIVISGYVSRSTKRVVKKVLPLLEGDSGYWSILKGTLLQATDSSSIIGGMIMFAIVLVRSVNYARSGNRESQARKII